MFIVYTNWLGDEYTGRLFVCKLDRSGQEFLRLASHYTNVLDLTASVWFVPGTFTAD